MLCNVYKHVHSIFPQSRWATPTDTSILLFSQLKHSGDEVRFCIGFLNIFACLTRRIFTILVPTITLPTVFGEMSFITHRRSSERSLKNWLSDLKGVIRGMKTDPRNRFGTIACAPLPSPHGPLKCVVYHLIESVSASETTLRQGQLPFSSVRFSKKHAYSPLHTVSSISSYCIYFFKLGD